MKGFTGTLRATIASWWSAWRAFLLLAVGELVIAALSALPGRGALASTIGQRPAIQDLAGGDWLNVLADFMAATPKAYAPGQDAITLGSTPEAALTLAILSTAIVGVVAVGLHGLLYNFVAGVALESMASGRQPFWLSGAMWFWPMVRLGVVVVIVSSALGGIAAFLLMLLPPPDFASAAWKLALWLIVMALLGSIFELTRAGMIVDRQRSWRHGIRRALHTTAARPAAALGLWCALTTVSWALTALVVAVTLNTSATSLWAAWAAVALAVTLGSGFKLFRLAAQRQFAISSTMPTAGQVEDRP